MARAMKDSGVEWIGEIPEGWETVRFKYLHDGLNTGEAIDKEFWTSEESDKPFYTAGLVPIKTSYKDFPPSKYTSDNDLLLARNGTPYVYFPVSGACYTDHIIRAAIKPKMNRRFIQYAVQQSILSIVVDSVSIATWSASLWNEQTIPWPPVEAQQRIVGFLDTECARIDAVIEQTRASIEEYKKLKQSVITQAVTKGIRPDRKMKDSGNNDMGCIPNEWEIVRLKYLTTDIVDCPHETPEYSLDGEYFVIRTADQDYARLRSDANMFRLAYNQYVVRTRRMTLDKDDIVYGREGERWGLACIVPESGKYCLGQRMMQFRCDEKRILPLFAMYALSSSHVRRQGEYDTFGSTSPHVNISTIRNYRIPLPIISEQKEICEYIHEKVLYLDTLMDKKEKEVAELESYKKSLIFEYVTGKKEVGQ